jgi:hypothetical protein
VVTFEFGVVFRSSEFGVCLRLTIGDVGNGTCEGEVPLSVPTTANLDGSFDSCMNEGLGSAEGAESVERRPSSTMDTLRSLQTIVATCIPPRLSSKDVCRSSREGCFTATNGCLAASTGFCGEGSRSASSALGAGAEVTAGGGERQKDELGGDTLIWSSGTGTQLFNGGERLTESLKGTEGSECWLLRLPRLGLRGPSGRAVGWDRSSEWSGEHMGCVSDRGDTGKSIGM